MSSSRPYFYITILFKMLISFEIGFIKKNLAMRVYCFEESSVCSTDCLSVSSCAATSSMWLFAR